MNPNQQAKHKDQRPIYKKKRFLIPVGIVLLSLIGQMGDSKNPDEKAVSKTEKIKVGDRKIDLKTRLENNIKSLNNDDLSKDIKSVDEIVIAVAIFKAYISIIREGQSSENAAEQKLAKELEQKVSKSQVKNFPKLRLAYCKLIKEKLWVNDIDVNISGAKNTTLQFTAGIFAANKNILETQNALAEMLSNLRFKQTQYRWYKGEDEYTYYNIKSSKDSEVLE